jgi:hypothetical protein
MPENVQLESKNPLGHGLSEEQLELLYSTEKTPESAFWNFDKMHPSVYRMIVHLARGLKKQGFKTYSMDVLFHRIRWHAYVKRNRSQEAFKLNDWYTSFYARLVMEREPDLADFFQIRKQRSKGRK